MSVPIHILSLDPSSTSTGYCLMATAPVKIVEAGLFSAKKSDPFAARIQSQIEDFGCFIANAPPIEECVIEMPAFKAHANKRFAGGAGLARYGVAVGRFWGEVCRFLPSGKIQLWDAAQWTRGISKSKRLESIALQFPNYKAVLQRGIDPGGDCGDAIDMAWRRVAERYRESNSKGEPPCGT